MEQMTLIGAVYWDEVVQAVNVLNQTGGGESLLFQFQTVGYPPSYMLLRQANNLYFVVAGTVNFAQTLGDIVGVFAAPYLTYTCQAHQFFLTQSILLQAEFTAALPTDWQSCTLNFVGHSYGGPLAFFMALNFKQNHPAMTVNFIGFGHPKCLTAGYNGPLPDVAVSMCNNGDSIPYLPPNGLIALINLATLGGFLSVPMNWLHYSAIWSVNSISQFSPREKNAFDTLNSIGSIYSSFTFHRPEAYMAAMELSYAQVLGSDADDQVRLISRQIRSGQQVQNYSAPAGFSAQVNPAQVNTTLFLESPSEPLTNDNLGDLEFWNGSVTSAGPGNAIFPFSTGVNVMAVATCKVTFQMHDGIGGFSESWYGALDPNAPVTLTALGLYLNYRMGFCGANTFFDYVRVSTLAPPTIVRTFYPSSFPVGTRVQGVCSLISSTGVASPSDFPGVSIQVRKITASTSGEWFLRGQPDDLVQAGGIYQINSLWLYPFNLFKNWLIMQGWGYKAVKGTTKMIGMLTAATQNADGTCNFVLATNIFTGVAVGTSVAARISKQSSPSYLNGPLTVVVQSPNSCNSLRVLPIIQFVVNLGKMTYYPTPVFPAVIDLPVVRATARKPGRIFGTFRGRSRNRKLV